MSDILSSKSKLPYGTIDCGPGEPNVVRETLMKVFDLGVYDLPNIDRMHEYPDPQGFKPLVKLLEEKYKAPVIITNGAKNALGAVFYALSKMDYKFCSMRKPYWALIPPLANMHKISESYIDGPHHTIDDGYKHPHLLLLPNNPDNYVMPIEDVKNLAKNYKDAGIPFIHDSAYFSRTYLPEPYPLEQIGDVQIYSISKLFGLSGVRIGYAVCPNEKFYKLILEYMEMMTVGVSIVSQIYTYDLLNRMHGYPTLTQKFEGMSFAALQESKKIIKQVDPQVLEVPSDIESTFGMFGFFKTGPKFNQEKAKVNFIDGSLFGQDGYVRMNLAHNATTMQEIVNRLNASILE